MMFDEINKKLGKWIQILDSKNDEVTIEDFHYSDGVNGVITMSHCEKCVAINQCWFKDEKEKKPKPYPILGIKFLDDLANEVMPGLYHFRCHCYEFGIITPDEEQIELIVPRGKEEWLFSDKGQWINSLGYFNKEEFLTMLYSYVKKAYCNGNYNVIEHTKFGLKINLFLLIPGGGTKVGKNYKIKSSFMVFPNGKLKCNTLIGGWWQ